MKRIRTKTIRAKNCLGDIDTLRVTDVISIGEERFAELGITSSVDFSNASAWLKRDDAIALRDWLDAWLKEGAK